MANAAIEDDLLLDHDAVAERLGIKASAVRSRRHNGEPFFSDKGLKIGKLVRWRKSDLDAYIANLPYVPIDEDED